MFVIIFLLLRSAFCDDVTTPHLCKEDGKCYTVILNQHLSWNNAEKYCEKNFMNGKLASVHSAFDNAIIASWLPFASTNPWIGASRVGSNPFSWTDGTDLNGQYTNWAPGEPSKSCAQVCHKTTTNAGSTCQQGKWSTSDCSNQRAQFICEYGNLNEATTTIKTTPLPATTTTPSRCPIQWTFFNATQACYRIFFDETLWAPADDKCRHDGGNLTSIHSDEEHQFLGELALIHRPDDGYFASFYIGMSREEEFEPWTWTDGTSTNYCHFASSSLVSCEVWNYVIYNIAEPGYKINEWYCAASYLSGKAYACKRPPNN